MHVNPRPASVRPYPPSLYLPGSYGRFRQYPRVVQTPIPGAGYRVGKMVWGEQVLDLDGSSKPYPYGQYPAVPLRGMGQSEGASAVDRLMSWARSNSLLVAGVAVVAGYYFLSGRRR